MQANILTRAFAGRTDLCAKLANGVKLQVRIWGERRADSQPLLLIPGHVSSLSAYSALAEELTSKPGVYCISFDPRDYGLSSRIDANWELDDWANDCVLLLDYLGLDKVHVLGSSLGGQVAQIVAVTHHERVASGTFVACGADQKACIMSMLTTAPSRVVRLMTAQGPTASMTKEEYVEWSTNYMTLACGRRNEYSLFGGAKKLPEADEQEMRRVAEEDFDRGVIDFGGYAKKKQGDAHSAWADKNIKSHIAALKKMPVRSLVLIGDQDPLVPMNHAKGLAHMLPNATLKTYAAGHFLPQKDWDKIVEDIRAHLFSDVQ